MTGRMFYTEVINIAIFLLLIICIALDAHVFIRGTLLALQSITFGMVIEQTWAKAIEC
jgi:hypothetical protein